jgi:hypothetical protein
MRKEGAKRLTLSKETIASLEDGKLINVVGGVTMVGCPTHTCPNTR